MKSLQNLYFLLSVLIFYQPAHSAELPPDAKAYLQKLPGGKITVPFLVQRSIEVSDTFQSIKSDLIKTVTPELQSYIPLETNLTLSGALSEDKKETSTQLGPAAAFAPDRTRVTSYTLGANTYFRSGSLLSVELSHLYNRIEFPSSETNYYETLGKVTLTQNLLKDSFGYRTRKNLEAGKLLSDALKEDFQARVDAFVMDLVRLHYNAWYLQAQVRAARTGAERRQRLLKITKVKARRGTSEKPDLLQVQSAVIQSDIQVLEAQQSLGEIWRNLVTSLKFPKSWLNLDPILVPMQLDEPIEKSLAACGPKNEISPPPTETTSTRSFDLRAKAASLAADSAKNGLYPSLQFQGSLESNDLDADERGETFSKTISRQNPAWNVGLFASFPISRFAEKAELATARADRDRLEALNVKSKTDLSIDWINSCANLHRLHESTKLLAKASKDQTLRAELEEKRFRLARVSPDAVIRAGDDATDAELRLRNSETMTRLAAWEVIRLRDEIKNYVKGLGVK